MRTSQMAKNSPASPRVARRGTARPTENRFIGLLGGQTLKFYHNPPDRTIPNRVPDGPGARSTRAALGAWRPNAASLT